MFDGVPIGSSNAATGANNASSACLSPRLYASMYASVIAIISPLSIITWLPRCAILGSACVSWLRCVRTERERYLLDNERVEVVGGFRNLRVHLFERRSENFRDGEP